MSDVRPTLVFFGSDTICLPVLDFLTGEAAGSCRLAAVVSQPDRARGRGKHRQPNPVAAWARQRGFELLQPERPGPEVAAWIRDNGIGVSLVMAYGEFLPGKLRHAAAQDMLNFHGSILPLYRGASPIETAVAMGETETGMSLMRVEAEMDSGPVADVERVRIEDSDTGGSVRGKLALASVPLLRRNLAAVLRGGLVFEEQDPDRVCYCRRLVKADGAVDFSLDANEICLRVRGFDPWPGSFFDHGEVRVRIGGARPTEGAAGAAAGEVLFAGEVLRVAAGRGSVEFTRLQRPGGRMLPAADFLRGHPVAPGTVLTWADAAALVAREPGEF